MATGDTMPCVNCSRTDEHLVFISAIKEFDKDGHWCVPCVEAINPKMGATARAIGQENPFGYVGTVTGCQVVMRHLAEEEEECPKS